MSVDVVSDGKLQRRLYKLAGALELERAIRRDLREDLARAVSKLTTPPHCGLCGHVEGECGCPTRRPW